MAQRLDLHNLLKAILGSNNVYFQPPPGFMLSYPCIVYERSNIHADHGDNMPLILTKEYTITSIAVDPDSTVPDQLAQLPRTNFDRHFTSENLNHDVFSILF